MPDGLPVEYDCPAQVIALESFESRPGEAIRFTGALLVWDVKSLRSNVTATLEASFTEVVTLRGERLITASLAGELEETALSQIAYTAN